MKIRHKLSLIFTLLASVILLFSFSFTFYLTDKYTQNAFYSRLFEKASILAQKCFEQDELSNTDYLTIIEKNSVSLPEAREIVMNVNNPRAVFDTLKNELPVLLIQQLLEGKTVQHQKDNRQIVGLYYPDNQGNFILVVSAVDKVGINKQKHLLKVLIGIFFSSLLFMFLFGQFFAHRILSPLGHMLKNVRRIRANNLSLRLNENNSNDELGELTRMLNQMLDRLHDSFTMQKNFISNASHELKNPLTAILGEAEIALYKPRSNDEYVVSLQKIQAEAERLNQLTRNLLSLAQADFDLSSINQKPIRIDELIWSVKEYFEKSIYSGRLEMHFLNLPDEAEKLTINGIESLLHIALTNIIDNACKFSVPHKVNIILSYVDNCIKIVVEDKGVGIPENELDNLFQPFFRASNAFAFKGSGIGLSLTYKVIKLHKGEIKVFSKAGQGTRVEIIFAN